MNSFFVFLTSLLKTKNEKGIRFSFANLKTKNEFVIRFSFANLKTKKEKTVYTRTDDAGVNLRLAGKFDYKIGTTMCSHFVTMKNGSRVVISERPIEFRNLCLNSKIKIV